MSMVTEAERANYTGLVVICVEFYHTSRLQRPGVSTKLQHVLSKLKPNSVNCSDPWISKT